MQTTDTPPQSLYDSVGGMETFRKLAQAFYTRVDTEPLLRPLYPPRLECPTETLALFFVQFFGGPHEYARRRGYPSLRAAHARFRIGPAERDAWLRHMTAALEEACIAEPARSAMLRYFEEASAFLINHSEAAAPARAAPESQVTSETGWALHRDVLQWWAEQRAF